MSSILNIQELAVVVVAKDFKPTALNLDFLKYSNIVPSDWELARPPLYTNQLVQLFFQNGLGLVGQPNRVVLAEVVGARDLKEIQVADVACNYIETLVKLDYQTVGINFTGYITFDSEDEAYQFFSQKLLAPGSWQEYGEARLKAGLQLAYTLKRGQLSLEINQATVKLAEQSIPAILFSGSFSYDVIGETAAERTQDMKRLIQSWPAHLKNYQSLITQKFLTQTDKAVKPAAVSS